MELVKAAPALIHLAVALGSYGKRLHHPWQPPESATLYRFGTYFVWWIQKDINNYIATHRR